MRRAGVLETTIMAITGHRTRNMFDRYNIVDEQDIRDAVVKTTAYVSTLPAASTVIPLHPVEAIRPTSALIRPGRTRASCCSDLRPRVVAPPSCSCADTWLPSSGRS
jgi:hypothetical protein